MKEFVRTLKQVFLVSWRDMLGFSLLALLGGIAGIVITLIIVAIEGSGEECAQVGMFMALLIGILVYLFAGIFSIANEFNLAVSMGKTRKYYGPAKYLMLMLGFLVMIAMSAVVGFVENWLYPAIYPGIVCEIYFDRILLQPIVIFSVTLIGAMLVLLFGTLLLRFSNKVYVCIWALWIVSTMSLSRIASAMHEEQTSVWGKIAKSVLTFAENVTIVQIILLVLAVVAVGLTVSFGFLRQQRVTA